jgi:peptide/nickel transport system substrate-binding protein
MCPRGLLFNHELEPTNKVEVRKAIAHMINRKAMADNLWKPPSRITSRPWYGGSTMLNFASADLVAKYDAEYSGDQKKALEWFQKAGYTQKDGKLVDTAGKQLKLDVYTPVVPTSAEHPLAQKLVEDLKRLGVDASFKFEEGAPAVERRQKGEWHIQSMWQCGGNLGDAVLLYQLLKADEIKAPIGQLNQGTNWQRYKNPKFDELTQKLLTLPADDAEAKKLYNELYTIWMEDMVSLPLIETIYTQVANNTYWTNAPMAPDFYAHPANWHMTMMNIIKQLKPGPKGKA